MNTSSNTASRKDLYQHVTTKILEDLERGVRPWMKPWNAGNVAGPTLPLRHNGIPYQGVNVLLLWGEAIARGYAANTWMTFKQALELGAHVKKGEHGSLVVYADRITKTEEGENGEDVERSIPFLKSYTVFNVEQIEGLPGRYTAKAPAPEPVEYRHAKAEAFIAATGAEIRYGGNRAFYSPAPDFIQMPPPPSFRDMESLFSTKCHELTHWSGAATRCAREFGKRFGDAKYQAEEIVAEIGAAYLCAELGITPEVRDDHAAYLQSWIALLTRDKRAIFTAAAQAQRAVDFLRSLQPQEVEAAA